MATPPARSIANVFMEIAADDRDVQAALAAGDRRALQQALLLAFRAARPRIKRAVLQHTGRAAEYAFAGALVGVRGAPALPRDPAVRWASGRAARLITRMSEESKRAVSALVRQALSKGQHPHVLARELVRWGLGLDASRAGALAKATSALETAVDLGAISREKASGKLQRLAAQKTRSRAVTIARTEMLTARNGGRQAAWDEALKRDIIDRFNWAKKWIVNIDDRTSDVCIALDGEITMVDGVFSAGLSFPPAHPRCRCSTGLVRV